jgi:gas vesicle protein
MLVARSFDFWERSMLADSDWVAAVFGLVGVLVGGLIASITSVYLASRREERDREAARRQEQMDLQRAYRILRSELNEAVVAVTSALDTREWPTGWTRKAWSESWSKYRLTLAGGMDDKGFDAVASAYLYMGLLETGLAADKRPFVDTDEPFLRRVSQRIQPAIDALPANQEATSSTS